MMPCVECGAEHVELNGTRVDFVTLNAEFHHYSRVTIGHKLHNGSPARILEIEKHILGLAGSLPIRVQDWYPKYI